MKPKQLYLCGPITGIANYKEIFQDCAAETLNAHSFGYCPYCGAKLPEV